MFYFFENYISMFRTNETKIEVTELKIYNQRTRLYRFGFYSNYTKTYCVYDIEREINY